MPTAKKKYPAKQDDGDEQPVHSKKKVAQNSTFVLLGQIISLTSNLAVNVLLARQLGQAGYGIFSYSIIFVSFFALIPDFGIQAILVRELSRKVWNAVGLLGNVLIIRLLFSALSIIIAVSACWWAGFSETLFWTITILSLNILFSSKLLAIRAIFEAPFQAKLLMKTPILFQILDHLLLLVTIYILVTKNARLEAIVIGYVLSNVPGMSMMIIAALRNFRIKMSINRKLLKYLLTQSFPLWIYSILLVLFGGADTVFLREFLGESAVGIYSAAFRLTSPLIFIPNIIIVSLFPLFSRYYENTDKKLSWSFNLGLKMVLVPAFALAIITTFFSLEITLLLFGNEFANSAGVLVILMWCQVFLFMNHYFANALTSIHRQKVAFYAAAVMFASNCIANWFLIRELGITGAGIAKLISSVLGTWVMLIDIRKNIVTEFGLIFTKLAFFGISSISAFAILAYVQNNLFITFSLGNIVMLFMAATVFNKQEIDVFKSIMPYLQMRSNDRRT